jgi:hypothetical protein
MAAAARHQRGAGGREPRRRRRRPRAAHPSRPRLARHPEMGRHAPDRDLDQRLSRRRAHGVPSHHRRALADLGRRPHLPPRREGRPHADPRGAAGRAQIHRDQGAGRRGMVHRRAAGTRVEGRGAAHAGRLDRGDRRTRRHRPRRGLAHQGVPDPHHRPLPPALWPLHRRGPAPVRVRRHREPRHLSARRDRQPPFLAAPLRRPSTSRRSPATGTSSGPRPSTASAPARSGGSTTRRCWRKPARNRTAATSPTPGTT